MRIAIRPYRQVIIDTVAICPPIAAVQANEPRLCARCRMQLGSLHLKYHYWTRYGRNSHGFCAKRGGSGSLLGCDLNCIKMVRQKILDNICRNNNLRNNQPILFEENRRFRHKIVNSLPVNEFHYAQIINESGSRGSAYYRRSPLKYRVLR